MAIRVGDACVAHVAVAWWIESLRAWTGESVRQFEGLFQLLLAQSFGG
jgi:hypothetical protein